MSGDSTSDPARPDDPESSDKSREVRRDPMGPPAEPCECFCLHCRRIFMSDQIWFQRVIGAQDGFPGFWMCPTPNCDGAGFTFDIFPTDPNHPANEGWQTTDEDEDEEGGGADHEENEDQDEEALAADEELDAEWDPDEPRYVGLEAWDDGDDDMEGEEWKLGLDPGERPKVDPPPPGIEPRNWAEQEALYNAPDRRPREVDWSDREDRIATDLNEIDFDEDDIPF